MKLITLGCSLTALNGVKEELATLINADLLNLSHSAGSNQLQVNRLHDLILNGQLDSTDIVYWQITSVFRKYERLQMNRFDEIDKIQKKQFVDPYHHYVCDSKNIFDNELRIDLLCNSPVKIKEIDVNQDLQMLLATIIMLSHITPKIIIVFGWKNVMFDNQLDIFKNYLTNNHINFIDQLYLEYAIDNKLKMLNDMHPADSAGKQYAKEIVYPKLRSLGWIPTC